MNLPLNFVDPLGLDCDGGPATLSGTTADGIFIFKKPSAVSCPDQNFFGDNARLVGFFQIINRIKRAYCVALPSGKTVGVSGAIGGGAGSLEVVTNYNTGEVSGFGSAGFAATIPNVSANAGYIWNLGSSNSYYSGPFTNVSGSIGPIGVTGSASSNGALQPAPIFGPKKPFSVSANIGVSIFGAANGSFGTTYYSKPLSLGNITRGASATFDDYALFFARQICK